MTRSPATVSPDTNVADAHRQMQRLACHHLPVVDQGVLVGMLSSADVVKAFLPTPGSEPATGTALLRARPVAAIMTRRVASLMQNATLEEAARMLATGDFHALPIVAPGQVLAGIITATDLATLLVEALVEPAADAVTATPAPDRAPDRARALEDLYDAVRHYLLSGCGELEHGRLQLAFDTAREHMELPPLGLQVQG